MVAEQEKTLSSSDTVLLGSLLGNACTTLNQVGIPYWLDRGSLLGAARDGQIIPYDDDVDIAVRHEDIERAKIALEQHASEEEFLVTWKSIGTPRFARLMPRYFRLPEAFQNQTIDMKDYLHEEGGPRHADLTEYVTESSIDPSGTRLHDPYTVHEKHVDFLASDVFPLQTCSMEGHECKCPQDVSAYLSSQYGHDWYLPKAEGGLELSTDQHISYVKRVLEKPSAHLTGDMKAKLRTILPTDGVQTKQLTVLER
jgi:hypothetical protein